MTGRGRDTSAELVEVRTVLSRAENARETLTKWRANATTRKVAREGYHDLSGPRPVYVATSYAADPDVDAMIEALDEVIRRLDRWRRTGRAKN